METEAKIQSLFSAIDTRTATMTSAQARTYLQMQIAGWEQRERDLLDWCRHKRGANPLPGLDAFQVARILLDLFARADALSRQQAA